MRSTYAINSIAEALNRLDHSEAERLIRDFDHHSCGKRLPMEIIYKRIICSAELAIRTENYSAALSEIEQNMGLFAAHPKHQFSLMLKASVLEESMSRLHISSKYATRALGLAEAIGDNELVAKAYSAISHMFSLQYKGLAIYFLRRAERLYAEAKNQHQLQVVRIERAILSQGAYRTVAGHRNMYRLNREALRLIDAIDSSSFNPHEKRYYLYCRAFIHEDINDLRSLIGMLSDIEALPDKCRYEEIYIGFCLEKGLFKEADEIRKQFFSDARALHGDLPEITKKEYELKAIIKQGIPARYIPHHIPRNDAENVTLFDILDHYSLEDELWALDSSAMRCLFPTHWEEGLFEPVRMDDGTNILFPLGLAFNVYYRGQSKQHSPSKPTLYRNNMTDAKQFVERLKYVELRKVINNHPLSKIFKNDIIITAPDNTTIPLPLGIDSLALAQHYGIKTELMDLTTDKFVAAFFATTYCDENDTYHPITDKQKEQGVFYRYCSPLPILGDYNSQRLHAVGLQPFSRPGEQCGLTFRMTPDDDFNNIVNSADFFNHDAKVSEFIFNYTNRSQKLFPVSTLQKHADSIKKSKVFSIEAYNTVKKEFYPKCSEELLQSYLSEENVKIVDQVDFGFSAQEIADFMNEWENGGSEKMLKRIRPRFTYSFDLA